MAKWLDRLETPAVLQRGVVEQPLPLKDRVERAVLCARRSKAVLE
ncbi:hypothetical protein [Bradyrhizobium sp. UFLA05-112]|jgi:hypothetical protein